VFHDLVGALLYLAYKLENKLEKANALTSLDPHFISQPHPHNFTKNLDRFSPSIFIQLQAILGAYSQYFISFLTYEQ
jgi:hypothetical protein